MCSKYGNSESYLSCEMTIGDILKFKDEKNKISIKTFNILSGCTCEKCQHFSRFTSFRTVDIRCAVYGVVKDKDDSCWHFKSSIRTIE